MQPIFPQAQRASSALSPASAQGSGLWPHSPAIRFQPTSTCRLITIPPPTPVPRIAPNTTLASLAAPSTASESAKQFASFSIRTSLLSRCAISRFRGIPLSAPLFEFLISPVLFDSAPGDAMPTVPDFPVSFSANSTSSAIAFKAVEYSPTGVGRRRRTKVAPLSSRAMTSIFVPPKSMPILIPSPEREAETRYTYNGRWSDCTIIMQRVTVIKTVALSGCSAILTLASAWSQDGATR